MKKFNINYKAKPAIIILAMAIIVMIATLIYSNISKPEAQTDALSAEPVVQQTTAIIEPQEPVIIKPEAQVDTQTVTTVSEQDVSADTSTTESSVTATSIQEGRPKADSNPTPPPEPGTKDDVIDKNKKPTYTEQDTTPQESQPKMGDRNDKGQVYVEGFGWIKDEGGGGEGTVVDSTGDIDKQIGIMD